MTKEEREIFMEKYIEVNKAAWEEAFDKRDASWGADITERIQKEDYPFFEKEMADVLKNMDTKGKTIGHTCLGPKQGALQVERTARFPIVIVRITALCITVQCNAAGEVLHPVDF